MTLEWIHYRLHFPVYLAIFFWKLQRSSLGKRREQNSFGELTCSQPMVSCAHDLCRSLNVGILCRLILPSKHHHNLIDFYMPKPILPTLQSRDVFGIWRVADKILWIQTINSISWNMSAKAEWWLYFKGIKKRNSCTLKPH